jgi:outer membrane lipoprotein SlyB
MDMRGTSTWRALGAAGLALACVSSALAEDAPVRVRGTIEQVDGQTLMVKARDGKVVTVKLADNATVMAIVKAALGDIKPNSFVGVTALPQTDGSWRAVEVHIFPEALRGTGEGDRPWDLQPKSTMTNAAVAEAVKQVDGQTLTLKYKDGEKKITVPTDAPIVAFAPGDKADLKAGAKIFVVAATRQPDGTLQAARINVGKDGLAPPM